MGDINILNYVVDHHEYDAFRGASISLSSVNEETWISKKDFDE